MTVCEKINKIVLPTHNQGWVFVPRNLFTSISLWEPQEKGTPVSITLSESTFICIT